MTLPATKRVVDAQGAPVILVGHSYGGAVITEAGNDPNVAALAYIAAFAPDTDESVKTLIANPPPDAPVPPILPPQEGFLLLDRDKFHASFAADIPAEQAAFMADSQVPWGVDALSGGPQPPRHPSQVQAAASGHPAWSPMLGGLYNQTQPTGAAGVGLGGVMAWLDARTGCPPP